VDVPEIDVHALAELHDPARAAPGGAGVTVIDVRNPDEYEAGHVPGAVLIPLPDVAERVDEVPSGTPVYVICAMGGRSRKACELLAVQGRDVTNVAGGTNGWIDAGQPVTTGSRP
jgi:rhodanese-related sulfurtransferase